MALDGPAITVSASGRKKSAVKDPDSIVDYPFLWNDWLADAGDNYESHQALVINPDGATTPLTVVSTLLLAGNKVRIVVAGGTLGATHQLICRINTTGGLVEDQTLYITIREH